MDLLVQAKELGERAIIVGVRNPYQSKEEVEEYLDELALLAESAGAEVVARVVQERSRIDPAYFIGKGKVESLASKAAELEVNLIIFDDDLSAAQVRNLERVVTTKIVDRSGLILDIFARRAKTKEAKAQVELAQLKYLLPRLTRRWTHLSRQVGGIGTRGPGETQLEVDRRVIKRRINVLTNELKKIEKQRSTRRKAREEMFKVALVGYTNSGKSTLLNALTTADVAVDDHLFVTLDSTVRAIKHMGHRKILLIDTVGFIRKLPHHLIASFRSTLEEAVSADLLLHIIDISYANFRDHIAAVKEVLHNLNIADKPVIYVFNKVDKLNENQREVISQVREEFSPCMVISALKGIFLEDLKREILRFIKGGTTEMRLEIDADKSRLISLICNLTEVLEKKYSDNKAIIKFRADKRRAEWIRSLVEEEIKTGIGTES